MSSTNLIHFITSNVNVFSRVTTTEGETNVEGCTSLAPNLRESIDNTNGKPFLSIMPLNAQMFFPAHPMPDNNNNVETTMTSQHCDNSHSREASKDPANVEKPSEVANVNVCIQQAMAEAEITTIKPPSETTIDGGRCYSSNASGDPAKITNEMALNNVQSQRIENSTNSKKIAKMDNAQATQSNDMNIEAPTAARSSAAAANDTTALVDNTQATRSDDMNIKAPTAAKSSAAAANNNAQATRSDDATMEITMVSTLSSSIAANDTLAPSWLGKMLVYLWGVSDVVEWQDLVSSLIEFESMDPPSGIGVSFQKSFVFLFNATSCLETPNLASSRLSLSLDKKQHR